MEAAYDHIQEEAIPKEPSTDNKPTSPDQQQSTSEEPGNLNTDLQEAYRSFSASPWGARIGGFLATARKQGESYIQEGRAQASTVGGEAFRGFSDLRETLVGRARSLSQGGTEQAEGSSAAGPSSTPNNSSEAKEGDAANNNNPSSPGFIARFRSEAEKRLKDIQQAEDAADEALLRFGGNIKSFLRDAVTVAPPTEEEQRDGKVLFESKDQDGKRVIHTSRFDAQLHVIHCSLDSFVKDPASPEWEKWAGEFKVEDKRGDIEKDLARYEELRKSLEKAVPGLADEEMFWKRYYFLRMVVESEDKRRKEILQGANQQEEVKWDEDSDDEPTTPHANRSTSDLKPEKQSSETDTLKPNEPRRSEDKVSQAGSDASYDLVSGTQSRAPGSPKEEKSKKKEDSDDDDWE